MDDTRAECVGGSDIAGPTCPQCVDDDEASSAIATTRQHAPDVRVLDATTGEIVEITDVTTADPADLARVLAETIARSVDELHAQRAVIEDELVARLDRGRKWTARFGDVADGVEWEVVAASPKAGTATYDVPALRDGLRELVAEQVIDEAAAAAALKRTVTVTAQLEIGVDLDALAERLRAIDAIGGWPVLAVSVATSEEARAAGVDALAVIGDDPAAALVRRVKGRRAAARRRPKVTAKRSEAR